MGVESYSFLFFWSVVKAGALGLIAKHPRRFSTTDHYGEADHKKGGAAVEERLAFRFHNE